MTEAKPLFNEIHQLPSSKYYPAGQLLLWLYQLPRQAICRSAEIFPRC